MYSQMLEFIKNRGDFKTANPSKAGVVFVFFFFLFFQANVEVWHEMKRAVSR